jgi:hypothetical protein
VLVNLSRYLIDFWSIYGVCLLPQRPKAVERPAKAELSSAGVFLLSFWPLELLALLILFILRALAYGVFLIALTLALIFVRKPFLFLLLAKAAKYIGDRLLRLNTWIIKRILPQPVPQLASSAR